MTAPALTAYQTGINTISGDQLNTFEQTCGTFTDLRSFVGRAGIQIFARGAISPNDGLGGQFMWNSGSTAADNGVSVIVPPGAVSGAWNRIVTPTSGVVAGTNVSASFVTPTGSTTQITLANLAALITQTGGLAVLGGSINGATIGANTPSSGAFTTLSATGTLSLAHNPNTINVIDYGAVGNGTTDDSAAIQAAASACPSAGCTLLFPSGYTFGIKAPIYLKSNTHVVGYGAVVMVLPGVGSVPAGLISNQHYNTSVLTDSNITIEGLTADFGSSGLDGNYHFYQFNYVSHVQVLNGIGYGRGAGDYVASIGNLDVLEQGNVTSGFVNADFDHWGGTSDVRVVGNYSTSSCSVVMFDATITGSDSLTASNLSVEGNVFSAGGVFLDTLATNGVVRNAQIIGNTLQWVIGRGTIIGTKVIGNTFVAPASQSNSPIVWIDQGATAGGGWTGNPSNTALIGNTFNNPNVASGAVGAIRIYGGGTLIGNNIINSGSPAYTYPLILEGSDLFYGSGNNWTAGSSGGFTNNGAILADLSYVYVNGQVNLGAAIVGAATENQLQTTAAVSGQWPTIAAQGVDSDIGINLSPKGSGSVQVNGPLTSATNNAIRLASQTSGAASSVGTLTNAPSVGDPAFWLPITINNVTHHIPAW